MVQWFNGSVVIYKRRDIFFLNHYTISQNKFTDCPNLTGARTIIPLPRSIPISSAFDVGVQHSTVFTVWISDFGIVRLVGTPVGEVDSLALTPNPISFPCCIGKSNPIRYFCRIKAHSFFVKFLIFLLCLNLDEVAVQVVTGLLGTSPGDRSGEEEVAAMRKGG